VLTLRGADELERGHQDSQGESALFPKPLVNLRQRIAAFTGLLVEAAKIKLLFSLPLRAHGLDDHLEGRSNGVSVR
jgi:hypothetical protein